MTRRVLIAVPAVAAVILTCLVVHRIQLRSPSKIYKETGLNMPDDCRVVAHSLNTSSIADGRNYEWLLESDRPLTHWITSLELTREDGEGLSWSHVKSFAEIAKIARPEDRRLELESVWKNQIGSETSYLYVASGSRIALLKTFRP